MDLRTDITFYNLLDKEFSYIRNIEILLEVNFPLVFTFTANDNKCYLAYVVDFKRRKKVINLLYVETNYSILHNLVSQKISLSEALKSFETKFIHSHDKKEFLYDDLEAVYPHSDFYLTEILPNSIDIVQKRQLFQKQIEEMSKYNQQILINVEPRFSEKRESLKVDYKQLLESYSELIKNIQEQTSYSVLKKGIKAKKMELVEGKYEYQDRIYTLYNN